MSHSGKAIAAFLLLIITIQAVKIEKGTIFLKAITVEAEQSFKVDINSNVKSDLILTQSSKIDIEAKVSFSSSDFSPEFFSFRLRHIEHDNLSEPIIAQFDHTEQSFKAVIDLGDPKQIQPFTGDYRLQIIISDDRLDQNVRRFIANCKITFRISRPDAGLSDLHYIVPSTILTNAPAERVDPPRIFTAFIIGLLFILFGLFIYGLNHQKANVKLFPTESVGFITNILFLVVLFGILSILFKFWLNWTFIETIKYILFISVPTAFVSNYAFVHIKKE